MINNPNILIISIFGLILVFIGGIIFYFKREILSFIQPQKWVSITMIEIDNNVINWIHRKKGMTFDFNNGTYNLFNTRYENEKIEENIVRRPIMENFLYKEGRLTKYFYSEGNPNPIDMRKIEAINDIYTQNLIQDMQISEIIAIDDSFSDMIIRKYGIYIIGFMALVIFLVIMKIGG